MTDATIKAYILAQPLGVNERGWARAPPDPTPARVLEWLGLFYMFHRTVIFNS